MLMRLALRYGSGLKITGAFVPRLNNLFLTANSVLESVASGTTVGALTFGQASGSTFSLVDDAGGRFALSGTNINTTTLTDVAVDTVYNITVRETNAGFTNSPRDSVIAITVTAVVAPAVGNIVLEGDSIIAYTSPPSYARAWAAENPALNIYNLAVGGSGVASMVSRQSAALAYSPTHLYVGIGANDLSADTTTYLAGLYAYTDQFRNAGAKLIICTVLPKTGTAGWDTRRADFRTAILAAVGTKIDYVVDFDASPMGVNGAENNAAYYPDGLHPSSEGFDLLKRIFTPVMNFSIGKANEPLDFTYVPQAAATVSTIYDSANYTVIGLYAGETRPYSVSSGASVSKNNGAFVLNGSGTVVNGDTLKVRNSSSASAATQTDVSVTIGTTTATYSVTTAGAGARDWIPTDLGAKLKLWSRPEGLTETVADTQINTWADNSGNSVAVTGAGTFKPRLVVSGLNGFKTIKFLGTEGNFFTLPTAFLTGRTESCTFVVSKNDADPNTSYFAPPVGDYGTDSSGDFYPFTNGDIYSSYASTTRRQIAVTPNLASWRFASFHSKNSDWRYYVDGTNIFTTTSNAFAVSTAPNLGKTVGGGSTFAGQIAEVVDCNEVLTSTERQLVEGYLAWKYGLQANLPGGHNYASAKPTI